MNNREQVFLHTHTHIAVIRKHTTGPFWHLEEDKL